MQGHPRQTVAVKSSDETWSAAGGWQTTPVFLPGEPHEQYEKAKRYDIGRQTPPGQKVSNKLLGKRGGKLLTAQKEWRGQTETALDVDVSAGGSKVQSCKERYCISSVQFSHSVMSDSLKPMDYSTPGFPVHHQLPELAQSHVHRVGDAIQPSHPLSSPSSPALNLFQHQGLF